MSSNLAPMAIEVVGLSKCHNLYEKPSDRLKQFVVPRLRRMLGRAPVAYFREFWALREVSFQIERGEVFGIVGRNGAGKSTLLQLLCGTLHPTDGEVRVQGRMAALLELGSGFNPEFTGRENVFLNASVLGLSEAQTLERFDAIEAFADIGRFIDQPVKTYSSGMMVRLAFAVIAHVDADILVIDEALSVGDAFFTQKCMRFLREFMRAKTVVFVSHDIGAVKNLCTRAIWLDAGRVVCAGTPQEVCDKYLESELAPDRPAPGPAPMVVNAVRPRHDVRQERLAQDDIRNSLDVYEFDPHSVGVATGVCEITEATLVSDEGTHVTHIAGGESVLLCVTVRAHQAMPNLIVGFYLKDRLGQMLFGDNTYISHSGPLPLLPGQEATARFRFDMPRLAVGTYHLTLSAASGTQQEFVQHHWIHEAITIVSQTSSVAGGLIGLPMHEVSLTQVNPRANPP